MAWSAVPTAYMANWSEDGTDITVPIASFSELTAAEADAVTGDIRKIIFAFMQQWYTVWNGLATGDKSTKMTMQKNDTLLSNGNINRQFIVTFQIQPLTIEVPAE
jgi:hypothetical protein